MKIEDLYDKEISRRINPAVVVSELDEYSINQEINEYVFTPDITKNIYKFLDAIANKKEGKTGVWISGYYGSGKSHFIKYLFYCLNKKYSGQAFENFKNAVKDLDPLDEPNIGLASSLEKKLEGLKTDEILFNIDAVADHDDEKDRITRVLLNQLNAFRGYNGSNIALALYLEKPLDESGHFDAFKEKVKATFSDRWEGNQIRFVRTYLDKVIQIAQEFDANIDKESLKSVILNRNQDYTIDFFIKELQSVVDKKDEEYRLIFLMDEVSQYINSNTSLLLNLQTIIEEIGARIGKKVWIVCTAQQDLSSLISNTDSKTEDFGKIMGRFETMISLQSQDAAFITKKRVLNKKSVGMGVLADYYASNKGAIENQFVFDHDLYENFTDKDDFVLTYPFIPYQFRLISDVFESFSNVGYVGEGVKNTERAILGITHYTAKECKDKEVGYFVPFNLFFNQQLEQNLTHHARGILDRAYHIDQVKNDKFSRNVVNALFMISNLGESQSVNFPANIENLSILLMDSVNIIKSDIQTKVQTVLDILVSKNIIQVSEGKYRFLKEDEIEVAHLIKNTTVTNEDRLSYIYDDIIQKVIKPNPVVNFYNRNFRMAIKIDDKEIGAKGDFNLKFSIYDTIPLENMAHNVPSNELVIGISEWLDLDLKGKINDYVRTQKYIYNSRSSATGTRTETLKSFRQSNELLINEIRMRFENKFPETSIISKQRVLPAKDINGSSAASRLDEMVKCHMEEVYSKHTISNSYANSNADLLANAKSKQLEANTGLTPAEEELNTKLNLLGEAPNVGDVVKQFEKAPYGWKDISTLDILLKLAKKGQRRFEWKNEEIDLLTFADKALNARERDSISIHKEKVHSQEEITAFIKAVNDDIFAKTLIPSNTRDFKEAIEAFKNKIGPKLTELNRLKEEYENYPFASHLKEFHKALSELYQSRNQEHVLQQVIAQKESLKQQRDAYKFVEEFLEYNFKNYEQIAEFSEQNKNNFASLDEILQVTADELIEYIKTNHEPWEKFPQMRKAYKELYDAIKQRVKTLKTEVLEQYEKIFEEIDQRKKDLNIDMPHLTTDASYYLQRIKKEEQIVQLEIYQYKANDIRVENFKKLEDYKAEQEAKSQGQDYVQSITVSVAAEMEPTKIENPEQLDEYIDKLRERLMVKLAKNKKIFLN